MIVFAVTLNTGIVTGVNSCLLTTQVLFKMFLGSANLGEVAHFLSTMGFFNLIFISCVPLILYFTKVEHWGSLSSLPWGYLCGLAGLWLGESAYTSLKRSENHGFPHMKPTIIFIIN